MSIIADRGLFVRPPEPPGKSASADADAFADAVDAATREPVPKIGLKAEIADLRSDIALMGQRRDAMEQRLAIRIEAMGDRRMVQLGGPMIALTGAPFAAPRLTQP